MDPAARSHASRPAGDGGDWAVVSPHFDDVAFSLGALLLARPHALKAVVNVFTDTSDYRGMRTAWRSNTDERSREDEAFFRRAGVQAEIVNLGFADAPLRLRIPLAAVCRPDGRPVTHDGAVAAAVAERVAPMGTLPVGFPMAIGGHIDHLVVSEVGVQRARTGHPVFFYEDLPYAGGFSRNDIVVAAQSLIRRFGGDLTPVGVGARHGGTVKEQAIAEYQSQVDTQTVEKIRRHEATLQVAEGSRLPEMIWVTAAVLAAWRPVLETGP